MNHRWTPEEDELIYRYGSQFPLEKLAIFVTGKTGIPRSLNAIKKRRRNLDPAWDIDPVGFISFHTVTGYGVKNLTQNERALRQAQADGVLKRRYIGGWRRVFVPVKWADAWIAKIEEERNQAELARAAGWLTTKEIAAKAGVTHKQMSISILRRHTTTGPYQVFRDVESIQLSDRSFLWEPVQAHAAIAAFKRIAIATVRPTGWWTASRTAREFGIGRKSFDPPARWLLDLGFGSLRVKMNDAGRRFWHPDDIRAFMEANVEAIEARTGKKERRGTPELGDAA